MKLSVIMPMYNTVGIKKNIKETIKILDKITKDYEIVLVDDGSKNGCRKEALELKNKKVKVVGYQKNAGKGNAIKYGFNYAKGKYVAFVDTGGDLNPAQLKDFLEIIEKNGADIVVGSKKHPKSIVKYPLARRLMSLAYQIVNKLLFNLKIRDTQVGIKLFKREVLVKVIPKIAVKRFAFDLELLIVANKYGFKIVEAPIVLKYKFKSTVNLRAIFWILWDTAAIFYRDKILKYYD